MQLWGEFEFHLTSNEHVRYAIEIDRPARLVPACIIGVKI